MQRMIAMLGECTYSQVYVVTMSSEIGVMGGGGGG